MKSFRKFFYPIAVGVLRVVVVPIFLIVILTELTGFDWSSASVTSPSLLVFGLIINQVALAIFAVRMQFALRLCNVHIGWWDSIRIYLQSMFYFFALPMTIGLEIARFVKVRAIDPLASDVGIFSALLLDRIVGAASALLLALICLPFVTLNTKFDLSLVNALIVFGALVLACVGLLAVRRVRVLCKQASEVVLQRWAGLLLLFMPSMGMHLLFAWAVQCIGNSIGLPITFLDTCVAVAGGMLLVAVPVSFAGFGPAEAGAATLFVALGYDTPIALLAAGLPYLARMVAAGEGALWEMIEGGTSAIVAIRSLAEERQKT
jgi:uncharacterized membrane protein YbhN (UPF0104 family)